MRIGPFTITRAPPPPLTASARAIQADIMPHERALGTGADWAPTEYADYYAKSVPVYAAIRTRADALSSVPWQAQRRLGISEGEPLASSHPLQRILDRPNPWYSGSDLRRATEINLCIWGRAYWSIETQPDGATEIWPLRPDRMTPIPGDPNSNKHVVGYLYRGLMGDKVYLPEEVEQFQYFNPMQERTGLSPLAAMRISADMGMDAIRNNRNTLRNGALPQYILLAKDEMTEANVAEFYERWEARFQGPNRANRPAIASFMENVKRLAFTNKEMEFNETLAWTIKDASRVFGVPVVMLADLEFATLANMENLERIFWRATMLPEMGMIRERINASLLLKLGYPNFQVEFDTTNIDALNEGRAERVKREGEFLDRGVITINEVRIGYGKPEVPWGHLPTPRALIAPAPPQEATPTPAANGARHA